MVCLIRQLESIVRVNSYDLVLEGKSNFLKKIENECGKDVLRYMRGRTNRLASVKFSNEKNPDYLKETQNTLLETVFDRKLENIKSEFEAKQFFYELQKIRKFRANIPNDNFYEEYYKKVLEKVEEKLRTEKVEENIIQEIVEQYKEPPKIQLTTKEDAKRDLLKGASITIANEIINNPNTKAEDFEVFEGEKDGMVYYLLVKDNKPYAIKQINLFEFRKGNMSMKDYIYDKSEEITVIENDENTCAIQIGDKRNITLNNISLLEDMEKFNEYTEECVLKIKRFNNSKMQNADTQSNKSNIQMNEMKNIAVKQKKSKVEEFINKIKESLRLGKRKKEERENIEKDD